jgi:hypothetical protein
MAHPHGVSRSANLRARRRTAMPHTASKERNPAAGILCTVIIGFRPATLKIYDVKPII